MNIKWYIIMYIIDEPKILFELDFWPCESNTKAENVNAVTRFVVLATMVLFAHRKNYRLLAGGIVLAVIIQAYCKKNITPVRDDEPEETPDIREERGAPEAPKVAEYHDRVHDFANFAYGDINKNLKQN